MLFINRGQLDQLLKSLSGKYRVFIPNRRGESLAFLPLTEDSLANLVIGEVRAFEPLKAFYFLGREKVADGFSSDTPRESSGEAPVCMVGVKACDLRGFRILDRVFIDEETGDPTYMNARREGLIISSDCTGAIGTCFCTAVGVNPWPEADFDINLSPTHEGFLVLTGSEKGKSVIEQHRSLFHEADDEKKRSVQHQRGVVKRQVEKGVADKGIPQPGALKGIVRRRFDSAVWKDEAGTCVECGACNTICPTCHCFFLYEQKDQRRMARFRIWDSCLIKDFARVAGGENPRARLWMRLRNRFEKKFDFFPNTAGEIACTGCGRCIAACPGKIDIRKVLGRLGSE
jgi:sulfhydrogenase subunit beta (sulfur reductase)